jgi:glutamate N-acetyltransferase/amino-acid N-acetyltransferase
MSGCPPGFVVVAAEAGFKGPGRPDVALFYSPTPCTAAALFTRNLVAAAPVVLGRELLARPNVALSGVFINSKNANAVTGQPGLDNARQTARWLDEQLGGDYLVMSTGVIGQPMPMDKIRLGVERTAALARAGQSDPEAVARAIMTTDTVAKTAERSIEIDGTRVSLWGTAKGAGMIHPDMATMLAVVLTDAVAPAAFLDSALRRACDSSFHCISVDGDTSTNDTLVVLANGVSGKQLASPDQKQAFEAALAEICQSLARQIAFDGEGARHHVTLEVSGCANAAEARQIGRTIITSPLVKTAIYGRDANWGRVLAAAGRSGVSFDPAKCDLWFGPLELLRQGLPVAFDETRARAVLSELALEIRLSVGSGPGSSTLWTCDLTEEYITINADYRT